MFKRMLWVLPTLLVLAGGAAFAGFGNAAPPQEVARQSLDLLKTMGPRSATAHTYIGTCVTAIAHAKRLEGRKATEAAALDAVWMQAAGRCRGMASTVCSLTALEAPREACNRIRAFEPLVGQ